jgi:hypothetical protein
LILPDHIVFHPKNQISELWHKISSITVRMRRWKLDLIDLPDGEVIAPVAADAPYTCRVRCEAEYSGNE